MRDRRLAPSRARYRVVVLPVALAALVVGVTIVYAARLGPRNVHLPSSASVARRSTMSGSPSQSAGIPPRPTPRVRHSRLKPTRSSSGTPSALPTSSPTRAPTPAESPSPAPPRGHSANCAPEPHACGYPDSTNTGVPAGTALRKVPGQITKGPGWHWDPRGWIVATKSGAVIKDISVNASISVNAPNVTIKDSYVGCTGSCDFIIIVRDTTTGGKANANNTIVEDSTIIDTSHRSGAGISAEDVQNTRVLRDNISGEGVGVLFGGGGGEIENTYIHDLAICCGFHNEDFQTTADGNAVLEHNTLFNQNDQTSDVQITQDFGGQANVTVDNNLLAGGGYSVYGGNSGAGKTGPARDIKITNNRLSKLFFNKCGYYGWLTAFNSSQAEGNILSGNYWDATGKLTS